MPNIILRNLSKTFKLKTGPKTALSQVNIEIPDKSFVILTGESGAGKSTLLNMIGGLELPTTGEILIDHQDINQLKPAARTDFYRHKVGFVFQGFYLQPQLTIAENIGLPGVFVNMNAHEQAQRTQELALMLNIADVLNRKPEAASGGQVERACIARALFMHPEIVLADEPTNNLDPSNAQNVVELFHNIWQQTNSTMIIASHDERFFQVATKVLQVADGHVTELGNSPIPTAETKIDYETIPTN